MHSHAELGQSRSAMSELMAHRPTALLVNEHVQRAFCCRRFAEGATADGQRITARP